MKIAITSLACLLGLGFTACVEESQASEASKATPAETPKETPKEAPKAAVVAMTTTALEMGRVP